MKEILISICLLPLLSCVPIGKIEVNIVNESDVKLDSVIFNFNTYRYVATNIKANSRTTVYINKDSITYFTPGAPMVKALVVFDLTPGKNKLDKYIYDEDAIDFKSTYSLIARKGPLVELIED